MFIGLITFITKVCSGYSSKLLTLLPLPFYVGYMIKLLIFIMIALIVATSPCELPLSEVGGHIKNFPHFVTNTLQHSIPAGQYKMFFKSETNWFKNIPFLSLHRPICCFVGLLFNLIKVYYFSCLLLGRKRNFYGTPSLISINKLNHCSSVGFADRAEGL